MKTSGLNAGGTMQLMNAVLGAKAGDAAKVGGADFESLLQQAGTNQQPQADAASQQDGQPGEAQTEKVEQPQAGQQAKGDNNAEVGEEQQALAAALVTAQPLLMPMVQPQEITVEEQQALTVEQMQETVPQLAAEAEIQQPQVVQPQAEQAAQILPQSVQTETAEIEQPQEVPLPAEQRQQPVQTQQNQLDGREPQSQAGQTRTEIVGEGQTEEANVEEAPVQNQAVFTETEAVPVKVREAEQPWESQAADAPEQLASKLNQALLQGESRVTINLNPANLGSLTVEMTRLADGTLNVVLSAVTERAANMLQQHSGSLQNILQTGTQNQVRVEVENRTPEDAQQFLNPNQEQDQNQQQEQQRRQSQNDNPAAAQTDFMQQLRLGLVNLDSQEI